MRRLVAALFGASLAVVALGAGFGLRPGKVISAGKRAGVKLCRGSNPARCQP
jgi:hypothetical protein